MFFRIFVGMFGSAWNLKRLCMQTHFPLLKKIFISIWGLYQYENGSSVAWNSYFAGVPCFPHGMKSIFISGGAIIGRNCVIFQQVTIGSNAIPESKGIGAPVIGDNCYIGAGAKIIGNVKVGNNVRIGANVVVYADVPDNCVVLSGEQKNVVREGVLDNRFYSFHGHWVYFNDGRYFPVVNVLTLGRLNGQIGK